MTTGKINIGDTPTLIITNNEDRKRLYFKNVGVTTVYIGSDDSVTASNGFPIRTQEEFINNDYAGEWYGISESSEDNDVLFMEESL